MKSLSHKTAIKCHFRKRLKERHNISGFSLNDLQVNFHNMITGLKPIKSAGKNRVIYHLEIVKNTIIPVIYDTKLNVFVTVYKLKKEEKI